MKYYRLFFLFSISTAMLILTGCGQTTSVAQSHTPTVTVTETATPEITSTPEPTPTPTVPSCLTEKGIVERVELDSTVLGTSLFALVYTPRCYDPMGNYPVLYLLHGQGQDDKFWFNMGVTHIADEAIDQGQKPFMIVMPYEERNYDRPGDSKYDQALLTDLIPWIDENYATCTDRMCRALGGISRGGGWAVRLVVRNFDKFGALGAHSFGLMQADGWWIQNQLKDYDLSEFPRIYIDRGDKDYLYEGIEYFVNILVANKIPHEYHIYPGIHEKAYWQAHVQEYMDFYMAGWE